jgi:small-conductance mechanosensitive channel
MTSNKISGYTFRESLLLVLCAVTLTSAVPAIPAHATDNPPPITDEPTEVPTTKKIISSMEFWMSAMVLFFGLIVFLLEYLVLTKNNLAITSYNILSIFSITLIVIGTLFLLTSAYSVRQIAPAMGLFGTIAGYLLGRGSTKKGPAASDE